MVILKDRADALLALSIFLIAKAVLPLYSNIPYYREFYYAVFILIILLNFSNSISYNTNILKASISFNARLAISYVLTEALIKITHIDSIYYIKIAILAGVLVFYLFMVRFLRWGDEKIEGKYRIASSYFFGEIIFFYGALAFAIYILFWGGGFWLALKVFLFGYVAKILFRIFTNIATKSHIRELLKRFGERWWKFKIVVMPANYANAFAFWDGDKNAIGITTGMVKNFTANEINFAVAHEYAHHKKNHITIKVMTEMIYRGGIYLLQIFNLITPFTLAIGGVVHLIKKALYKAEESEADEVAVKTLIEAGLTQKGAITLFEKLIPKEEKRGILRKLIHLVFEDHPYIEKRIENVRKLIKF